jgi:FtsP/CotA-like multicopper oxidase with cupredoxin domain
VDEPSNGEERDQEQEGPPWPDAPDSALGQEPNPERAQPHVHAAEELRPILLGALALLAVILVTLLTHAVISATQDDDDGGETSASEPAAAPAAGGHSMGAAETAQTGSCEDSVEDVEEYRRPDPRLPAPPSGPVKKFRVDVFEHVTCVSDDKPATRVWSFGVNGELYRGTGASTPMVVTEGDKVEITLVNGASDEMAVTMPHSIDYHSSELAPNKAFKTIQPGEKWKFSFTAKHPGVFMYHCATPPVLQHTGLGMVGMMVVKPKNLAPVDTELWVNQQEFYLGEPGKEGPLEKMAAIEPDVIAFNGYASQYEKQPIEVSKGERIRMYVLNSGPSSWSSFHVIGTVFDRTVIEGTVGEHAQAVNLGPAQGGWVEFTLDREGTFPFVDHSFAHAVKGAIGVLATENSGAATGDYDHGRDPEGGGGSVEAEGEVDISLLDPLKIDPATVTVKAEDGKVRFNAVNDGASPHTLAVGKGPFTPDASGDIPADQLEGDTGPLGPGEKKTLEVELDPGTYELLCTITGHYAGGQKATLEVTD